MEKTIGTSNDSSKTPIYVAPYFNGPVQIVILLLFNSFLLYMGVKYLHWLYFVLLTIFCLIPFVEKVSIYDDKIVRKRTVLLYSWNKAVLLSDAFLFKYQSGSKDSNRYILKYKEEKKTKIIGFYITKKKDMQNLLDLFCSKGIKVEGNFKWILQILD